MQLPLLLLAAMASLATAAGPPTADSATTDLTTADTETSGDDTGTNVDNGVPDDAVILQGPDNDAFCFCASFEDITDDNATYYVDNVDTAAICLASDSIVAYYDVGDGKIVAHCQDKTIFQDAQSFADACAEADPLGLNNGAGCCGASPDPCNNFAADPEYIGAGVGGDGGTEGGDPSGGMQAGDVQGGADTAMGTDDQGTDASGQMSADGAEEGNEEGKKEKKGKKSKKPPKSFRL
ncbi:uncharacterized protein SEPMUDRAFT_132708 [Sphaerulina musiva SO2202]|uniref:Uncharacterized protein n=1 Tax=Sphaerulina musiva (strain SO2202) TaxID=692275 RepID=M3B0X9_SPHMS|nr:uncharacterized protein SEPMUDRAFT_132708 [Sphaerulina musiva SO2202]EMF13402.1 hypothetical protein SEPMUDRAFT_132708 [Sphaerulina musiva SO2202]